jgi:hypothetical protein
VGRASRDLGGGLDGVCFDQEEAADADLIQLDVADGVPLDDLASVCEGCARMQRPERASPPKYSAQRAL